MNLKEIKHSKLLNNLDKIAEKFNVYGNYVEINNGLEGISLYFVAGLGKFENLTPEKIKNSMNLSSIYFPTELKVFCLDNICEEDECKTFFEIATYLDKLNVVYSVYVRLSSSLPPSVLPNVTVDYICDYYLDWQDLLASISKQKRAEENLKDIVNNNVSISNSTLRAGADYHLGMFFNGLKMLFSRYPNKVSLKHLYEESCFELKTYTLDYSYKKVVMKELRKHPHILYSQTRVGGALKISVNSDTANEFVEIIHKLDFKEAFKYKPISLKDKYGDLYLVKLPHLYINSLIKQLYEKEIEFCYATSSNNVDLFTFPIFVAIDNKSLIDEMLVAICQQKADDSYFNSLCRGFDLNKYNAKVKADKEYKRNNYKIFK